MTRSRKTQQRAANARTTSGAADGAGQAWFVSLIACPFLGWLVASSIAIDWTATSWRWRSVAGLALGAGVPLALAARAAWRSSTSKVGFFVVTLAPIAALVPTARRLVEGPRRVDAVVRDVTCELHARHTGTFGPCIRWSVAFDGLSTAHASGDVARSVAAGRACVTLLDDVVLEATAAPCAAR